MSHDNIRIFGWEEQQEKKIETKFSVLKTSSSPLKMKGVKKETLVFLWQLSFKELRTIFRH